MKIFASYRNPMAISATLHCLAGCAVGEVLGMVIGSILGLNNSTTVALTVVLAFLFGYSFSTVPLIKAGLSFGVALSLVLAADTLSILTMEIVDNAVMLLVPGAMESGLLDILFWVSMALSLTMAFVVAVPVNAYMLSKGKGHALVHKYHHDKSKHQSIDDNHHAEHH